MSNEMEIAPTRDRIFNALTEAFPDTQIGILQDMYAFFKPYIQAVPFAEQPVELPIVDIEIGAKAIGDADVEYHQSIPVERFNEPYMEKLRMIAKACAEAWGLKCR